MLKRLKSKTYWASTMQFLLGVSLVFPAQTDPIWQQFILAGMSVQAVAVIKLSGLLLALFLTWYGRDVATDWRNSP